MDLSVVIVSWNVKPLLRECLASVCHSLDGQGTSYEVIVVDNASTDSSANMVAEVYPKARLMANADNRGFAAASNQGVAESSGRYVVLLNPDTTLRGNALGTLLGFMDRTPSAGMAGPRLVFGDGSFQHSAFEFPSLAQAFFDFFPVHHRLTESSLNGRYPRSLYASGDPFAIDHPLGACMMVRRAVIEQVGGLDEQFFMYCEEVDWAMRIKEAGWDVFCVPAAEVVHHAAQSTRQSRDAMFVALWRSRFRLFAKHYGPFYNWAVRRIVLAGLWREARQARRQADRGLISGDELAGRLATYAHVRRLLGARTNSLTGMAL
jgi:GT2 family glycosyltransferase